MQWWLSSKVIVLEAEDRLGGRIETIPKNGNVIELGAQWIHGRGENPLWKFVVENKVLSYLNPISIFCQTSKFNSDKSKPGGEQRRRRGVFTR